MRIRNPVQNGSMMPAAQLRASAHGRGRSRAPSDSRSAGRPSVDTRHLAGSAAAPSRYSGSVASQCQTLKPGSAAKLNGGTASAGRASAITRTIAQGAMQRTAPASAHGTAPATSVRPAAQRRQQHAGIGCQRHAPPARFDRRRRQVRHAAARVTCAIVAAVVQPHRMRQRLAGVSTVADHAVQRLARIRIAPSRTRSARTAEQRRPRQRAGRRRTVRMPCPASSSRHPVVRTTPSGRILPRPGTRPRTGSPGVHTIAPACPPAPSGPSRITPIRSAMVSASSWSCVTRMNVDAEPRVAAAPVRRVSRGAGRGPARTAARRAATAPAAAPTRGPERRAAAARRRVAPAGVAPKPLMLHQCQHLRTPRRRVGAIAPRCMRSRSRCSRPRSCAETARRTGTSC